MQQQLDFISVRQVQVIFTKNKDDRVKQKIPGFNDSTMINKINKIKMEFARKLSQSNLSSVNLPPKTNQYKKKNLYLSHLIYMI